MHLGFLYLSFSENTIRADIDHGKEAQPMSKLTWKKTAALVMAVTMLTTAAAGCGNNASSSASSEESSTSSTVESNAASATEEETDEMAAKNVADLIDAIYVQELESYQERKMHTKLV